jgi:spermidine synthase
VAHEVVARAESERGEVVVRRRAGGPDGSDLAGAGEPLLELRVNGVFVMDTAETGTERRLARACLDTVTRPARVLVGGLGLGYTLRELVADPRVEQVVVVEIEPAVAGWMRTGVLPGADLLDDPRVRVAVGDVRQLVRHETTASYDVLLLDVDNGPDFLVYDANAAVYTAPFLAECRRLLAPGGALTVWSSTRSGELEAALREVFGGCHTEPLPVDLQGRSEQYWLLTSRMDA